jgi:hypothetical protein
MKNFLGPTLGAFLSLAFLACGQPHTQTHPDVAMNMDATNNNDVISPPGDSTVMGDGPVGPDMCATNTDCSSCALDQSFVCGWCMNTNSCHTGTGNGPNDQSCTADMWAWTDDMCPGFDGGAPPGDGAPPNCGANMDCASCATDPSFQCGWCTNTNTCLIGSSDGPTNMGCTMVQWAWTADMCPGAGDAGSDGGGGG